MKPAKKADWKNQPLPRERTTIPLARSFTSEEMGRIRQGVVPEQMEDKWFVYWQDDALFFHRSWTGYCIYRVRFSSADGGYRMFEADVNRNSAQYKEVSDERDAEMISYLVDLLLLHQDAVFPSEEPGSERQALKSWSQVGRAMLGQHPNDE